MRNAIRRQVEPTPRPRNCLNCGVAVSPENVFCGQCGQENEVTPVSFAGLVREGWDEFIKVDKKLLATLGLLLFRPGYLTGEYVRGRRVAYISPFKLYVAVSALFFLVFGLLVPFDRLNTINAKLDTAARKIAAQTKKRDKPAGVRLFSDGVVIGTNDTDKERGFPEAWQEFRNAPIQFFGREIAWSQLPPTVSEYRDNEVEKPAAKRDAPLLHLFKERLIRFRSDPAGAAKSLFSTGLPFLLLIQLPLFAAFMRLIYFRQRRLYVEHLIFLLHTHAFFFLLFGTVCTADVLAQSLGQSGMTLDLSITWILLTAAVTIYNLLAYKRFYGQGWGKTLVKGWFLLSGYLFLFGFTSGIAAVFAVLWMLFTPGG